MPFHPKGTGHSWGITALAVIISESFELQHLGQPWRTARYFSPIGMGAGRLGLVSGGRFGSQLRHSYGLPFHGSPNSQVIPSSAAFERILVTEQPDSNAMQHSRPINRFME